MGRAGFEHTPLTTPKTPISEDTRTESGTVDGETQPNDPDSAPPDITALAALLTALPASDRASIIADLPHEQRLAVAKLIAARITEDNAYE